MSDIVDRRVERMSGCAGLGMLVGKWLVRLGLPVFALGLVLVMGFTGGCNRDWKRTTTRQMMSTLEIGLEMFHLTYDRYPIEGSADASANADGVLILPMITPGDTAGFRSFIALPDLPVAENGRPGLTSFQGSHSIGTTKLVDSWGEPYHLILDLDEDGKVPNPESDATPSSLTLPKSIAIYSSGPDRDPKTWNDNICSWR